MSDDKNKLKFKYDKSDLNMWNTTELVVKLAAARGVPIVQVTHNVNTGRVSTHTTESTFQGDWHDLVDIAEVEIDTSNPKFITVYMKIDDPADANVQLSPSTLLSIYNLFKTMKKLKRYNISTNQDVLQAVDDFMPAMRDREATLAKMFADALEEEA
jgi:hypothetical protein